MLRAGSWIARGIRSPSRDALLATLAPRAGYGRAYGLERAGDNLGAVAGPLLAAAFCLAGVGIGLAETAESTLVAHTQPDDLRGSGFGALGAIQAAGDFASSAVVGLLWTLVSPAVGFGYAAAWMTASLFAALAIRTRPAPAPSQT